MAKTKDNKLKPAIPSQGWEQFLTSRNHILAEFDKAKTYSKRHKVETYHGNVAEALFRKWLSEFLPKKYAVTSGYIISQGVSDAVKAPHFDVIIYNHLEAPILWIEDNPDASEQGRSLAIPAEYVCAVIEVKSSFKSKNVKDSINHLLELSSLMSDIDEPTERYKMYLPERFICGSVYFELRKKHEKDLNTLVKTIDGIRLRNYFGGLILRAEGLSSAQTGRISLLNSKDIIDIKSKESDESLINGSIITNSVQISDSLHICTMLLWAEINFSQFAFDLISMLNSTYRPGYLSSFYGFGSKDLAERYGRHSNSDEK